MAGPNEIRAGRANVEVGANTKPAEDALARFQKHMADTGKSMMRIGAAVGGVGAGVVGSLFAAAASAGAFGDHINDLSAKTGIAVKDLASLGYAAEQSGATIDTLETNLRKMQDTIANAANGNAEARKSIDSLGVSLDDLQGLSPDEQFRKLASAIASIPDPAQRTAAALNVFGKTGTDILPIMANGADGLKQLEDRAKKLGIVMGVEAAAAVGDFDDMLGENKQQLEALKNTIGAAVAQGILPYREQVAGALADAIKWASEHKQLIQTVAGLGAALTVLGGGLVATGTVMRLVAQSAATLTAAFQAISIAGGLLPFTLIAAAVAGLVTAFYMATQRSDDLTESLQRQADAMKSLADMAEKDAKRNGMTRDRGRGQLDRLKELSTLQTLTSAQAEEAEGIIASLDAQYGNLGVSVNQATGALEGFAEAQKRVADMMLSRELGDIDRRMKTLRDERKPLAEQSYELTIHPPVFGDNNDKLTPLKKQIYDIDQELRDLEARKRDLQQPMASLTREGPSATPGGSSTPSKPTIRVGFAEDLEDRKKALTELEKLEREADRRRMTEAQRRIAEVRDLANAQIEAAKRVMLLNARNGPLGMVSNAAAPLQAIMQASGDVNAAEVAAGIEAADKVYAHKLELEKQLAEARGDAARVAAIEAEQFLREQKKQIDDLQATPADKQSLWEQAKQSAAQILSRPQEQQTNGAPVRAFSAAQIAAAGDSAGVAALAGAKTLVELTKKGNELSASMLATLNQILGKIGLAKFG